MMAAVQRRTGPYNVGYFGLLQPMDDGLKLVKNDTRTGTMNFNHEVRSLPGTTATSQ